ncbi:MAG: GAF domain-containing protein, partial [Omnitrophica WOR_2 bacterium]
MVSPFPVVFGVLGILLGLVFFALVILLLRAVPKSQPPENTGSPATPGIASITDAVVLVQSGGRVKYINQAARELFGLLEEEPNLERLARRTRPENIFVELCAAEGQASFTLNGISVEGTSYTIPYPNGQAVLVSISRSPATPQIPGKATHPSGQVADIYSELSKKMSASLDLASTLKAVLESIERLIPADTTEITLWDPENQYLVPYRLIGIAGVDMRLEKSDDRYKSDQGYSGYLVSQRSHLLIGNIDTFREVRPAIDRKKYPFSSYLGAPLLLSGELVGTLELASLSKNAFTENDVETIQYLASQAAAAVHNASLYENEQRRVMELSGLARLFHVVGDMTDTRELFSRLIENIQPLLDVEVIGFWLYDESQQILKACLPFTGIPAQFLSENDRIPIKPGSQAEAMIKLNEPIVAVDAWEDPQMEVFGITPIAQAAGFHHTIFLPLISGGKLSGYFQAADKKDGSFFDQNDRRLLSIIASQAAMIIDNATLVQQTQKRAQRSEALRRIASLTGSSATLDEILKFSLIELARLFQADASMIFLLDENRGEFRLHKESVFGVQEESSTRLNQLSVTDSQSVQQSYRTGNAAVDEKFMQFFRPLIDTLGIQSAIIVPLKSRNRCLGIALLASRSNAFFEQNDMILMDTAAAQLAGAIEQSSLFTQTDESLRRRVDELTALTHISRELNTTLDLEYLLQRVYDELVHTTRADCGSILLFDPGDSTERNGQPPEVTLLIGDHREQLLSSLELRTLERHEPLVVKDFETPDQCLTDEVFVPFHPGIRSALLVPLVSNDHTAGLIHLHSRQPEAFDATSLEIAQALAIQAMLALNNAQRYQDQVRRSELLNQRSFAVSKLLETT